MLKWSLHAPYALRGDVVTAMSAKPASSGSDVCVCVRSRGALHGLDNRVCAQATCLVPPVSTVLRRICASGLMRATSARAASGSCVDFVVGDLGFSVQGWKIDCACHTVTMFLPLITPSLDVARVFCPPDGLCGGIVSAGSAVPAASDLDACVCFLLWRSAWLRQVGLCASDMPGASGFHGALSHLCIEAHVCRIGNSRDWFMG